MDALIQWLYDSWPSHFANDYRWTWPIAESVHFFGIVLLAGTVGAFDLRLLGVIKGIRPAELHRSDLTWKRIHQRRGEHMCPVVLDANLVVDDRGLDVKSRSDAGREVGG